MKCAAGIMTRQWGALHLGNKVANISIKPVLTDIWCEMVYYSTLLIVEDRRLSCFVFVTVDPQILCVARETATDQ